MLNIKSILKNSTKVIPKNNIQNFAYCVANGRTGNSEGNYKSVLAESYDFN